MHESRNASQRSVLYIPQAYFVLARAKREIADVAHESYVRMHVKMWLYRKRRETHNELSGAVFQIARGMSLAEFIINPDGKIVTICKTLYFQFWSCCKQLLQLALLLMFQGFRCSSLRFFFFSRCCFSFTETAELCESRTFTSVVTCIVCNIIKIISCFGD